MIRAKFYIMVDRNGNQVPLMNTGTGNIGYISNIAIGRMGYSKTVAKELNEIERVIDGYIEKHFLSYSDTISFDILKKKTVVYDSLGNVFFKPFEIQTSEIYSLLKEWYAFLLAYENGEIPGLTHPDERVVD